MLEAMLSETYGLGAGAFERITKRCADARPPTIGSVNKLDCE